MIQKSEFENVSKIEVQVRICGRGWGKISKQRLGSGFGNEVGVLFWDRAQVESVHISGPENEIGFQDEDRSWVSRWGRVLVPKCDPDFGPEIQTPPRSKPDPSLNPNPV